jgi:hypothetical protein
VEIWRKTNTQPVLYKLSIFNPKSKIDLPCSGVERLSQFWRYFRIIKAKKPQVSVGEYVTFEGA